MPRRSRTSNFEGLVNALAARLPWWACLLFALLAFLVLHAVATTPLPTAHGTADFQGLIFGSMIRGLALAGQYVVPIVAIAAALISFVRRRDRCELLLRATAEGDSAAAIDAMNWRDFERLIAEAFRLQGFDVLETGGGGADGGVDLEMTRDGERWLVQAKHWRARQVPVEIVRDLAGVMSFRRAVGAYVVTSGRFTGPAETFARGRGIQLVNGARLDALLRQARTSLDGRQSARATRAGGAMAAAREAVPHRTPSRPNATRPSSNPAEVPHCPLCDKPMTLRIAKKGANAGSSFWGCTDYPVCRGTRPA